MTSKNFSYFFVVLQGIIIVSSSIIDIGLFNSEFQTFSVWFALSLFSFSTGWLINKIFGWKKGSKLMFAVIIAATIINVVFIVFFQDFVSQKSMLVEDLILYTLRSFVLGAFGFFGMTLADYFILQKKIVGLTIKAEEYERQIENSEKQIEIIIKEAKLKAEQIVFDAEKKSNELLRNKNDFEKHIRELINLEKEIIKKYESEF